MCRMAGCCDPQGYDDMFGARFSRHVTSRYRRRGLDRTARRMVDYLTSQGLDGVSVLEIGGGIGEIHLELLRRGADRATSLELVGAYDEAANRLAAEAGLSDRIQRRRLDIAAAPDQVEEHDVVVLHRVVCCYPDYERLLSAAADRARRAMVFSHPPRNGVSRSVVALGNLGMRLKGSRFRTFAHPPAAMVAVAEAQGMRLDLRHVAPVWSVAGLLR